MPMSCNYTTFYHNGLILNAPKWVKKGLKIPRLMPCRFESGPGHHLINQLVRHFPHHDEILDKSVLIGF